LYELGDATVKPNWFAAHMQSVCGHLDPSKKPKSYVVSEFADSPLCDLADLGPLASSVIYKKTRTLGPRFYFAQELLA